MHTKQPFYGCRHSEISLISQFPRLNRVPSRARLLLRAYTVQDRRQIELGYLGHYEIKLNERSIDLLYEISYFLRQFVMSK